MTIKTRNATERPDATGPVAQPAKQPLALLTEASAGMLRAAGVLEEVHLQMLQRVALSQQQVAQKLRNATTQAEFMAVQSTIASTGITEAMRYWQELTQAHMTILSEWTRPAQGEATINATVAAPLMQAWQMFTAPLNGAGDAQVQH